MSKYHARRTQVDGHWFDSAKEAARYRALRLLEQAGAIHDLELQPAYPMRVNGRLICTYRADFRYVEDGRVLIVEDVKGVKTPVYRLKAKLLQALYGIEVRET